MIVMTSFDANRNPLSYKDMQEKALYILRGKTGLISVDDLASWLMISYEQGALDAGDNILTPQAINAMLPPSMQEAE